MPTKDRTDETLVEKTGAAERLSFEGIREVVAQVEPAAGTGHRAHARGVDALEHIHVACQPGGALHSGVECRRCARFVNWLPSPDRTRVTVRCLWRESDRVADLMAHASAVPIVSEQTTLSEALAEAGDAGMPYLVVVENGGFRGLLGTEDLQADPGVMVRDRMIRPSWSVSVDASLSDVVGLMKAYDTDVVPVLAGSELLGVITRAALCDAGLAAAFEQDSGRL